MRTTLLLCLLLTACSQKPSAPITSHFLAFGTMVDLSLQGVDQKKADEVTAIIEEDFRIMHHSWHAWDPGPLGRVNRLIPSGKPFSVPPSVLPLIKIGTELAEQSGNRFNPSIGKLISLWGFHSSDPSGWQPPSEEAVQKLLQANPRMTDLTFNGVMMQSSNPTVDLDFGAFGKGYGIDLAMEHIKELGISNAILNAGGDLRAIGNRGNHQPWRIAIRNPDGDNPLALLKVEGDESVFTSGDYERKYNHQGKHYHHIIDPRSGYPAEGTRSVTVLHNDATRADAAATALFVAGPDEWFQVAQAMGIKYVLLLDSENTIHMSPAMTERTELLIDNPTVKISAALK
jgi:thiamine biosynthesis lipoprotein